MNKEKIIDFSKIIGTRLFLFFTFCLAVPLLLVWCTLVIKYTFPVFLKSFLTILFPLLSIVLLLTLKDISKSLRIFATKCLVIMLWYLSITPSLNKNWKADVALLPEVHIDDKQISIKNFRNFIYENKNSFSKTYEEKNYSLDDLEGTDFIISYWDNYRSIGHTFVSFRFKGQTPLCISVEVRKEQGEKYHPVKGLFKQYELIYVIGDERDMIPLRTKHRAEETFLYPLTISKEQSERFLLSLLEGAQKLHSKPTFYHSISQNCTTTLVNHVNTVPDFKIKVNYDLIMNGLSDYAVYKMEGISNDLDFAVMKRCCYITKIANSLPLDDEFSRKIRKSVQQKIDFELNQTE